MTTRKQPYRRWTVKQIRRVAQQYSDHGQFVKDQPAAYRAAKRLDVAEETCAHMAARVRTNWTAAAVRREAKKYRTRTAFARQSYGAYSAARRLGILDEICAHMRA